MNKFQKERDEIFGTKKLNDARKRAVIDAVHAPKKRKKQWLPAVVVTGVLAVSSFLLFVPSKEYPTEEELYTATSLEQLSKQQFGQHPFETLKIIEPFIKDNGALIINKVPFDYSDDWYYHFHFAEKNSANWELNEQFSIYNSESNWESIMINGEQFFYGILTDPAVENVFVGDYEANLFELEGESRFWFGKGKSNYTPVYYVKDKEMFRQKLWGTTTAITIPFIEGHSNEQTLQYNRDTMYRGNKEYSEFPLLIDPFYYAQNPYQSGDVVLIETVEGLEVTRIIDAQQQTISIDESTIIIGENLISYDFYFAANYDGDMSIYSDERIEFPMTGSDEVFVHPDNWGSSGTRGPISKEAIKGKVIGYDLHGVTNTMTQQDLNLFSEVQEMVQKMKWRKYAVNPLNTILKDASAQSVAKLYFYAHYLEDYETMYALINQSQNTPPPYKQWVENMKLVTTKSSKQRLLVNIYEANRMTMNTATKRLEWLDENSGQTISYLPMVKDEGIWKITYETVKRN